MSHFDYVKELNDIVRLDGPLQRGPPMRWQRKAQETLIRLNSDDGGVSSPLRSKSYTPGKHTTPGNKAKTPSASIAESLDNGSRSGKKQGQKTPGCKLDRFIPNRTNMDLEYGHYAISKGPDANVESKVSPPEYNKVLAGAMGVDKHHILSFKAKAPPTARNDVSNLRVLYDSKSTKKNAVSTRYIPEEPERVLDAPDLLDDFYLNLLDWSAFNVLTVALGNAVFLWNAEDGTITQLMSLSNPNEYISCLSWVQEGAVLAVGLSTGAVQLWDTDQQKMLRTMTGHPARVGALSWNQYILSSGSRSGAIHHHDVRVAEHHVGTLQNHTQEVCGLKWSPNGRYLASGGNDNLVSIWSSQTGMAAASNPLHSFTHHQAAVKALAWCPWQPQILATGGGTSDRYIRMWNVQSGASIGATDTESQVCALLWSADHKELISGHGYALNQLRIWKYPLMSKVTDLLGHSSRVLAMAMSPDGTTVASAAADETIRLWKCFTVDKEVKKAQQKVGKKLTSGLDQCIR